MREKASELEYLRWFYAHADFGPAHSDVMMILNEDFVDETGLALPDGYEYEL